MKTYDLMHSINTRGTYLVSKVMMMMMMIMMMIMIPVLQVLSALPQGQRGQGSQPSHPQQLAASVPEAHLVQEPRGVHDGQVRDVHVCPRHGGGVQAGYSEPGVVRSAVHSAMEWNKFELKMRLFEQKITGQKFFYSYTSNQRIASAVELEHQHSSSSSASILSFSV